MCFEFLFRIIFNYLVVISIISTVQCCLPPINWGLATPATPSDGCHYDEAAELFNQAENDTDPVQHWRWRFLTNHTVVDDMVGLPHYRWAPDGHISTLQVSENFISFLKTEKNFFQHQHFFVYLTEKLKI